VKVTEHEPDTRLHVVALNEPVAPVLDHVTVPVGVLVVPAAMSVTVAVHVEACETTTGEVHETAVEVVLRLTVMVAVPELTLWIESAP